MPASGTSSSLTSTTARLLFARPWLAPALGGLVFLSGGLVWWLCRPRPASAPPIANVLLRPGLRSLRVSFTTPLPARASLDVVPTTDRTRLPPAGEPATEHQLDVTGLSENTDHKLTVALEGGGRITLPFRTRSLFIEHLKKEAHLDALKLSWTTSLPVRSSIVYAAKGAPEQELDVDEPPGTTHAVRIGGLSPDRDYEVTIISTTETREVHRFPPFRVRLFTSAANEVLSEIERAGIGRRILDVLWEYRHKQPDRKRLREMFSTELDPVRPPLALVRAISREFFSSPEVLVRSKLRVYSALKVVEHLERLAQVRQLPLLELLAPFDWGTYRQIEVSFFDPKLPLPQVRAHPPLPGWQEPRYFKDPGLLPGIRVDQQPVTPVAPAPLVEWRERQGERDAIEVFARGERDGAREMTFHFDVPGPVPVAAAELWLSFRDGSPLQYFELEVNGAAPLILRLPLAIQHFQWYTQGVMVDPALLVPGPNAVRLRLKPVPEMLEGRRVFVWFMELRTRLKGS